LVAFAGGNEVTLVLRDGSETESKSSIFYEEDLDLDFSSAGARRDPNRCALNDSHSVGDMLGAVPEEKETRAATRYETVIATFSALLAVCVAGYRPHAAPAGAGGGVADPRIR
jgi:hypothetical protein